MNISINMSKGTQHELIKEKETALLIVDCQEKLMPTINENKSIISQIENLIDACIILDVDIFHTEQNPDKLGKTILDIRTKIKQNSYSKMSFSCGGCHDLISKIEDRNIKNIIICGVETHVCILQTAIDLIRMGINVIAPADAIGSRERLDHEIGLLRLRQLGSTPSTTDSVIFELCKTSDRPEFRELIKIIKR